MGVVINTIDRKNKKNNILRYLLFKLPLQYMNKSKQHPNRTRTVLLIAACMAVAGILAWRGWPASAKQMKRSAAIVECRSWYEVHTNGRTLLYFADIAADSSLVRASHRRDSAMQTTYSTGVWINRYSVLPSCRGRLATTASSKNKAEGTNGRQLMLQEKERNKKRVASLKLRLHELNYYLRVHNVQDEGYNAVADYTNTQKEYLAHCQMLSQVYDTIDQTKKLLLLYKKEYIVHYRNDKGKRRYATCRQISTDEEGETVLLQTSGQKTPAGVAPQSVMFWQAQQTGEALGVGYGGLGIAALASTGAAPSIVPIQLANGKHDLPAVLGGNGSPIFSTHGRFIGMVHNREVITRNMLSALFGKEHP